jgi:hypothetical protein
VAHELLTFPEAQASSTTMPNGSFRDGMHLSICIYMHIYRCVCVCVCLCACVCLCVCVYIIKQIYSVVCLCGNQFMHSHSRIYTNVYILVISYIHPSDILVGKCCLEFLLAWYPNRKVMRSKRKLKTKQPQNGKTSDFIY